MVTRRTFAFAMASAGVGFERAARGFATAKDKGREIVDKTIAAMGGDAFRDMETRTEIGRAYSFYHERLSGLSIARLYTRYPPVENHEFENQAGPPQLHIEERQVFGKKQEDAILLTGKDGYEVTFRGAKPLAEDRITQFRESTLHDFLYILRQRRNEPGLEFESKGKDVTENQPVEALDIYDRENRTVTVWINSDTWLPVKQRYYRWDPIIKDRREEVTRYSRYRESGYGVMWPHATTRERDTEKIFEMYADEVKVGTPLQDSMFELPRGITILSK